jgi:release factor glutamine methyltransferase
MNDLDSIDNSNKPLLEQLRGNWRAQPDKPEETPETTFRALYLAAAGIPVSSRKSAGVDLPTLSPEQVKNLRELVQKRCAGTPLAHLTGRQNFMGVEMLAGPEALIPRIETEILGGEVLRLATMTADKQGTVMLLDVCTGCGNIPLAVTAHEPRSKAAGADISAEAVGLATQNARHLGLEQRVEFKCGDLFEPFNSEEFLGKFDIVSCNPPYIPSSKVSTMDPEISQHEPKLAFDGGSLGIAVVSKLIREAPKFLKPGAYLCFEVGLGQATAFGRMLTKANAYSEIRELVDGNGQVRVLVARRAGDEK